MEIMKTSIFLRSTRRASGTEEPLQKYLETIYETTDWEEWYFAQGNRFVRKQKGWWRGMGSEEKRNQKQSYCRRGSGFFDATVDTSNKPNEVMIYDDGVIMPDYRRE